MLANNEDKHAQKHAYMLHSQIDIQKILNSVILKAIIVSLLAE